MQILKRYFEKLKVKDVSGLTPAEKATYDTWVKVLSKETTVKDISAFLRHEIERLRIDREQEKRSKGDEQIRLRIINYKTLLAVIEKPERERKLLEANIEKLISGKN